MTTNGLAITLKSDVVFPNVERMVEPSVMQTGDLLAAYDFYTWQDSSGNNHTLIRGKDVFLDDRGALALRSGTNAYAICDGLAPPSQFSVVLSMQAAGTAGTLFGNYNGSDEGLRIYTSTTQLLARVGNTTGQLSLTRTTLNASIDMAYSYNAGAQVLCDETQSATGNDASPLGTSFLRFGASALSTPTASNMLYGCAAIYANARNTADLRTLIALAKAKRQKDGIGL